MSILIRYVLLFLVVLITRTTLVCAILGGLLATWGYYGYQRIACHPIFQTGNVECTEVSVLAAEHSLVLVQTVLPYQTFVLEHQAALTAYIAVAVGFALLVEIIISIIRIVRRKRAL